MALAASDTESRSGSQPSGPESAGVELADIRKELTSLAHSVGTYGRYRSSDALEDLRQLVDTLQHRAMIAEKKVEKNMREHPREWIGSAVGLLGIGVALGLILGPRD